MICSRIPKNNNKNKQTIAAVSKKVVNYANTNRRLVKEIVTGDTEALRKRGTRAVAKAVDTGISKIEQKGRSVLETSTVTAAAPKFENIDGTVHMTVTQPIDYITFALADYGKEGYNLNTDAYRLWEYRLNPLLSYWKQIKEKCSSFERFNITKCKVRYINALPTTTTGNVALGYFVNSVADLPADFTSAKSKRGAKSGHISAPLELDLTKHITTKIIKDGYRCEIPAARQNGGLNYSTELSAQAAQCMPSSFYLATEGVQGANLIPGSVAGNLQVELSLVCWGPRDPTANEMALSAGSISTDITHLTPLGGFNFANAKTGSSWLGRPNKLTYIGYTAMGASVHIEITYLAAEVIDPVALLSFRNYLGTPKTVVLNNAFAGTSDDTTRKVLMVDAQVVFERGDSFSIDPAQIWTGIMSIDITPSSIGLTSVFD